jgi:hypothetical protein
MSIIATHTLYINIPNNQREINPTQPVLGSLYTL